MSIKPCGHRLVVKPYKFDEVDEISKKHLEFLKQLEVVGTETRNDASVDKGIVISVGPTAWKDYGGEPWAKVGDEVIYAKFAGKIVKDGDDNVVILNDEDIVAVTKEA
jgi:co-chaperonin GroES (HSP10)